MMQNDTDDTMIQKMVGDTEDGGWYQIVFSYVPLSFRSIFLQIRGDRIISNFANFKMEIVKKMQFISA
jgi:hypothetical protein